MGILPFQFFTGATPLLEERSAWGSEGVSGGCLGTFLTFLTFFPFEAGVERNLEKSRDFGIFSLVGA